MDYIIGAIILLILSLAIFYIVKAKKSGVKCIGCVHSKTCSGKCNSQLELPQFIETDAKFKVDSCKSNSDYKL